MFAETYNAPYDDSIDEPIPETSRSPSFVRVRSAEEAVDESSEIVIADSARHDTIVAPRSDVEIASARSASARRWDDLEVDLKVQMLRLEEENPRAAARVQGEIEALGDALRAIAKRHDATATLCRHAYEWASNVAVRLAAPREIPDGELGAAEYSSLFVCKILEPMIDAGIEVHAHRGDHGTCESLHALREHIFWLNWSARAAAAM